ncbi:hypothetical protein ACMV_17060 [Acidiphilium multivorum AIU301]|uniref:MaoC domain protein dehydratase n=2 Tax=Acidiphilium TaxID=522 RepID=A5FZ35_ACICJ|nr:MULTISPECIES: MaoC family dehydratase [Acidiphilium]ABQ30867.1 MaoC domain protein dehydratase [Acidiphilium cryptum JF-5]BAJ81053.1 hypothetical protein ACMV_17060 [Acidiphilium multivorum AIU301]GAN74592.1 dehydratase [Acidiphilium multivorum AIU301]
MSLFFDDLAVGTRFESGTTTLDAAAIREFAARYDPQPFHLDDAAARTTLFGGLAASGWHTAAVTMRLLVESVPIAGGLIGAGNDISWPRPTRPGDVLRVVTDVVEMTPSASRPDRGRVVMRSETLNQNGEVVQILLARLVVPRRAP